jgi:hypothetical protein
LLRIEEIVVWVPKKDSRPLVTECGANSNEGVMEAEDLPTAPRTINQASYREMQQVVTYC